MSPLNTSRYLSFKFNKINLFISFLIIFSFPAYSIPPSFSFIEFNIAFVLGVSLPILLMAVLIKPIVKADFVFPASITLSMIGFLSSLAYLVSLQAIIALSFAIIFVALLYFWPLFNELTSSNNPVEIKSVRNSIYVINVSTVLYLISLWMVPDLDAYLIWAVVNFVICFTGGFSLVSRHKLINSHLLYRTGVQWLLVSLFVTTMYFWLNGVLSITFMVIFAILSYISAFVNGNWMLLQRIITARPIDKNIEQISSEELFSYTHDPATNLPSYQQALKCFDHKVKSTHNHKLAIIVIKPVNFQQVNSILGHQNSDILLLQLAYCLQKKVADNIDLLDFDDNKQSIRIARLQSLHFLVILDLTQYSFDQNIVINDLCQQLAESVPQAMSFKSFSLNFELAFGAAITGEHGNDITQIIAHATDALLLAEKENKLVHYYDNSVSLYTERNLVNMERLKSDIIDDNLYWYLQPQINLNDNNIKGFELMVHWYNGGHNPLELQDFVEIAEHSGDLHLLTKRMVTHACQALEKLFSLGIYQPVSVNLTSKDLLEPDLVDFIEQQIQAYSLVSKYLIIEVTEAVILSASGKSKALIDQLKSLGVGIAIDHFSGSYEALRYLRKMSVESVKINCDQLGITEETRTEKAIVNALINLVSTMNLPLIGININNAALEQTFLSMGGTIAQGNNIKHGVVIDELEVWLNTWYRLYPNAKPDAID